jgi:phospholipid-binding lipoprotein MlaA
MTRLSFGAICVLVALLVALPAGRARAAEATVGMGWFERYNRLVFGFNGLVDGAAETVAGWVRPPRTEPEPPRRHQRGGPGNMLSNLVNEPMTMAASLAVADLDTAWIAGRRFAVNTTVGFLGWYDRAAARGLPPVHADVGLALCRYGVGEGGYVMLPFVGPRTIRDAVADVVVINAILWSTVAALAGTGASLQTILVAEAVEIAADIVATRQIDPKAKALGTSDYDATRAQYLEQRRARCADTVAGAAKPAL